jgi:hypothetical protein
VIALLLGYLIEKVGVAWCLRILGLATLACVIPAVLFIKERAGRTSQSTVDWQVYPFCTMIAETDNLGACSRIYGLQLSLSPLLSQHSHSWSHRSSCLCTAPNSACPLYHLLRWYLDSTCPRHLVESYLDYIGPVNALILAMICNGFALLVLWPVSMSLAPLIVFVIVSGISAGKLISKRGIDE